jgi:uncharacterized protein GlcG (DUF336 family)
LNSKRLALTLVAALAGAAAPVLSAPPTSTATPTPSASSALALPLPESLAIKAAKVALNTCVAQGYKPTVTITDRDGVARVVLVADGADPVSIIASRRKAYTAAALGISTQQLAKNIAGTGIVPASVDPQLITFGGGFPILRGEVVIGGIAVGGADRDNSDAPNEACAQAGLAAIRRQLEH